MYSPQDQNRIICATFALHNYIRLSKVSDPAFRIMDADPNFIPPEIVADTEYIPTQETEDMSTNEMTQIRNDITASLVAARRH